MKNFIKKTLAFGLSSLFLLGCINTTVFANSEIVNSDGSENSDSSNITEGKYAHNYEEKPNGVTGYDDTQNRASEYKSIDGTNDGEATVKVYVSQEESAEVIVPKTIILDGTNTNAAQYKIKACGNIAGDTAIVVRPESNESSVYYHGNVYNGGADAYFYMGSKGKQDVIAEVNQVKDTFVWNDLKDLEDGEFSETTGTVESTISAGMWHGTFNFNVELLAAKPYYSSLSAAVNDANNLTTENADITAGNADDAVAGLYIENNKAYIFLMDDITNQEAITLNNNTELELGGYSISFKKDSSTIGIRAEKNLSVKNGTITVPNKYGISSVNNAYNSTKNLYVDNVDVNLVLSSDANANCYGISSQAATTNISNSTIDVSGTGNSSKNAGGFIQGNTSSETNIKNCEFLSDVENVKRVRATQFSGNTTVTKSTIDFDTATTELAYGFYTATTANNTDISDCEITIEDETYSVGMLISGNNANINNCNIYSDVQDKIQAASALDLLVNNVARVNNCNLYGKDWGIECFAPSSSSSSQYYINNTTAASTDHTGYIGANADIRNCDFIIKNRDKYSALDIPAGLYFGGATENTNENAVVNMYNCRVGSQNASERAYYRALAAQNNYGYVTIDEINLYDCEIYQGIYQVFIYNFPRADAPAHTKFNLYGNTKVYDKNLNEISKERIQAAAMTWRNTPVPGYNGDSSKYNPNVVGTDIIWCSGAVVDTDTGEISTVYANDDANVYDYR